MIGFIYFIYFPFFDGEKRINLASLGAICIHPDHQGSLGFNLSAEADKALSDYLCTHTSKLGTMIHKRLGAKEIPAGAYTYQGILSIKNLIRSKGLVHNIMGAILPGFLFSFFLRNRYKNELKFCFSNFENNEIHSLSKIEDFFNGHSPKEIGILRDNAYFKWRYLDNPLNNLFKYVTLTEEKKCVGWSVLVRKDNDYLLYEISAEKGCYKKLLEKTMSYAQKQGGVFISVKFSSSEAFEIYRELNFQDNLKDHSNLIIKKDKLETDNIDFHYSDLKIFAQL